MTVFNPFQPAVLSWLENPPLFFTDSLQEAALHLLLVHKESDNTLMIDAQLPEQIQKELSAAFSFFAWQGKGHLFLSAGGKRFLALAYENKDGIPMPRQARALGLQLAAILANVQQKELLLLPSAMLPVSDVLAGLLAGWYAPLFPKKSLQEEQKTLKIEKLWLLAAAAELEMVVQKTCAAERAASLVRMLQDAAPNLATPSALAEVACERHPNAVVLTGKDLQEQGLGAFWSVAKGSVQDPRLVVVHLPGVDRSRRLAVVGKGVTFDSGGISLKPGQGMEEMKYDMSGAAVVLGLMDYFSREKPPCDLILAFGATENMPDGQASKPSDVVTAYNGKTIEVDNTDAEGRLVLADVLAYVEKNYTPNLIIDLATLTGAVIIALGHVGAAVCSNRQSAAEFVLKAAEAAAEPAWQLPLWPDLREKVKGTIADLRNITDGSVKAGSITGALFLQEFIENTPWVHLDIAGTAWASQAVGYPAKGGTAYGLRLCLRVIENFAEF